MKSLAPVVVLVSATAAFAQSSPSSAVTKYMDAWKQDNPSAMLKVTQKRMRTSLSDIKGTTSVKKLKSYKIVKTEKVGSAMTRFTIKITYSAFDQKPETHTIKANVINEDGQWGVNYISTMREE